MALEAGVNWRSGDKGRIPNWDGPNWALTGGLLTRLNWKM